MQRIDWINKVLTERGLEPEWFDEEDDTDSRILTLQIGQDGAGRPREIACTVDPQINLVPDATSEVGVKAEETMDAVNLDYIFPFSVDERRASDVARLCSLLNTMLPVPGFYLDEIELAVHYKLRWLELSSSESSAILESQIGTVAMFTEFYLPAVEAISQGSQTYMEFVETTLQEFTAGV